MKAGIEHADSLISCTDSDDTNALVARIAKKIYKVPKVIARLYDSSKVDFIQCARHSSYCNNTMGD